ncbi:MAG: GrpB family protein [Actinomycetota bacterium]|nr:GrpB family protein [Actinomycetota bacterium]
MTGQIQVVSYDAEWPRQFEAIAADLRAALVAVPVIAIEHVGSTAVPGLAAKPIIDIAIVVERADVDAAVAALEAVGYVGLGEMGIPDRHALRAPDDGVRRNTYVSVDGSLSLRNHRGVRDVLRARPDLRDRYGAVKLALADSTDDIDVYIDGKTEILQEVLQVAGIGGDELSSIEAANRLPAGPRPFGIVAFDADDTLWHSEDGFDASERRFVELLTPFAPAGIDVKAALTAVERKNLSTYGYGVKAFGLSAVEAALTISDGRVPTAIIGQLLDMIRATLTEPVRLLPHVPEVLAQVGAHYRLVLITKGDLIHQTHKVETSGLAHHFTDIEIVLEKDPGSYDRLFRKFGVPAEQVCMVGNSVRSDILPVMALGGTAVHVPYPLLWELEHVEHDEHFAELESITQLPGWLGID